MYSYWEKEYWFEDYDYVILGGGITGLSTAYYINQIDPLKSVLIIDKFPIPRGASTKNAGFACFGTAGEILDDLDIMSEESIIELIKMRWDGLKRLNTIHMPGMIQYVENGGYELFDNKEEFEKCTDNIEYINRLMEVATGQVNVLEVKDQSRFSGFYSKSLYNRYEGELNPVKLLKNLHRLLIGSKVHQCSGLEVESFQSVNGGFEVRIEKEIIIRTKKLIVCTNAFTGKFLDLDVVPVRNQVILTERLKNFHLEGDYHFDRGYVYFRKVDGRLLVGGARNLDKETETTNQFGENAGIIAELERFTRERLLGGEFKTEYKWSGIIASGSSKMPLIERRENGLILAVRLGGMGVAIGSELAFRAAKMANQS